MSIRFCPECGKTPSLEVKKCGWKYTCHECLATFAILKIPEGKAGGFAILRFEDDLELVDMAEKVEREWARAKGVSR